jgi:hypothetical protein
MRPTLRLLQVVADYERVSAVQRSGHADDRTSVRAAISWTEHRPGRRPELDDRTVQAIDPADAHL